MAAWEPIRGKLVEGLGETLSWLALELGAALELRAAIGVAARKCHPHIAAAADHQLDRIDAVWMER